MEFRVNANRAGVGSTLNGGSSGIPEPAIASGPGKLRFSGDLRLGRDEDIEDKAVSGEGKIEPALLGISPGLMTLDCVPVGNDLASVDAFEMV